MKAIMIPIHPKWMCLILNGTKKIEVRSGTRLYDAIKRLIEEQGKAIILGYCTSHKNYTESLYEVWPSGYEVGHYRPSEPNFVLNGKVVISFEAVAEKIAYHFGYYTMGDWAESFLLESSCLTAKELDGYLKASKTYDEKKVSKPCGTAILIKEGTLKVFDEPKELWEFDSPNGFIPCNKCLLFKSFLEGKCKGEHCNSLYKAPQSYCYVEVDG